jgi:hypothetical protein
MGSLFILDGMIVFWTVMDSGIHDWFFWCFTRRSGDITSKKNEHFLEPMMRTVTGRSSPFCPYLYTMDSRDNPAEFHDDGISSECGFFSWGDISSYVSCLSAPISVYSHVISTVIVYIYILYIYVYCKPSYQQNQFAYLGAPLNAC